jgi:hypothetical protein
VAGDIEVSNPKRRQDEMSESKREQEQANVPADATVETCSSNHHSVLQQERSTSRSHLRMNDK